jgi:hypothetical protein
MKKTLLVGVALVTVGCGEPGRSGTPVKLTPANGRDRVQTVPQVAAVAPRKGNGYRPPAAVPNAVEAVRLDRRRGWEPPHSLPVVDPGLSYFSADSPGGVVVDRQGNATVAWKGGEARASDVAR